MIYNHPYIIYIVNSIAKLFTFHLFILAYKYNTKKVFHSPTTLKIKHSRPMMICVATIIVIEEVNQCKLP